jgi:hypothetical protein
MGKGIYVCCLIGRGVQVTASLGETTRSKFLSFKKDQTQKKKEQDVKKISIEPEDSASSGFFIQHNL